MKMKYQLLLTHGMLIALAVMIVIVNAFTLSGMDNDATITNQMGKLRALSYRMSLISNRANSTYCTESRGELSKDLKGRIDEFDLILLELGDKEELTKHNPSAERLKNIASRWNEDYKLRYLRVIEYSDEDSTYLDINEGVDLYVSDINALVTHYAAYSRSKIKRALEINALLVVLITIVSIISFSLSNRRIRKPINDLMEYMKELSDMDENILKNAENIKANEISEMTLYFKATMLDQLTKTFNRRAGLAKLNKLMQTTGRRDLKISLCFLDINFLKEVNDQLGHRLGDVLIIDTVEAIKQEIRDEDFIIRMGGDEFLIVFKGIDSDKSEMVWQRIVDRYEAINNSGKNPFIISVSHGICHWNKEKGINMEALIKEADEKMYAEKKLIKTDLKNIINMDSL